MSDDAFGPPDLATDVPPLTLSGSSEENRSNETSIKTPITDLPNVLRSESASGQTKGPRDYSRPFSILSTSSENRITGNHRPEIFETSNEGPSYSDSSVDGDNRWFSKQNYKNISTYKQQNSQINKTGISFDTWHKEQTIMIPIYESIQRITISPDGSILVIVGVLPTWSAPYSTSSTHLQPPQPLQLYSTSDGTCLWGLDINVITAVRFSKDGTQIMFGTAEGAAVMNVKRGYDSLRILKYHEQAKAVVYVAGGNRIVSVTPNGFLRTSDIAGREIRNPMDMSVGSPRETVSNATFSPDGNFLVTITSGNSLTSWNTTTGEGGRIGQQPLGSEYTCLAFSLSGDFLATAVRRHESYEILIWDMDSRHKIRTLSHERTVTALAFTPSKFRLASCSSTGHLSFWDTESSKVASEIIRQADEPPKRGLHIGFVRNSDMSKCSLLAISPEGEMTRYLPVSGPIY